MIPFPYHWLGMLAMDTELKGNGFLNESRVFMHIHAPDGKVHYFARSISINNHLLGFHGVMRKVSKDTGLGIIFTFSSNLLPCKIRKALMKFCIISAIFQLLFNKMLILHSILIVHSLISGNETCWNIWSMLFFASMSCQLSGTNLKQSWKKIRY